MKNNQGRYLFYFGALIIFICLIGRISAIPDYDSNVYKVNSIQLDSKNNVKSSDYVNYINYYDKCCNYNYKSYYTLPLQNNPNEKSLSTKPGYSERSYQINKRGFLGTYVKEYTVEITNNKKTGNYFSVKFNLKDKYGYERAEIVTHYIRTGETQKFVYKNVQFEKNEILDWRYTII